MEETVTGFHNSNKSVAKSVIVLVNYCDDAWCLVTFSCEFACLSRQMLLPQYCKAVDIDFLISMLVSVSDRGFF